MPKVSGSASGEGPAPAARVLLVDDDQPLREMVCELLREEGFQVVTAPDGQQALDLVRQGALFDVLVLDDEMPRLRGRDLLSSLRADGYSTPAVLVSGSLELTPAECARLGVGRVITKPVPLPQLTDAIREAAGKPRQLHR